MQVVLRNLVMTRRVSAVHHKVLILIFQTEDPLQHVVASTQATLIDLRHK